jgi:hypothetical protein
MYMYLYFGHFGAASSFIDTLKPQSYGSCKVRGLNG